MELSLFYLPTWRKGFNISLGRYYEEIIETVKLADSLGWSRALTTEHHFHYYGGAVPNPSILLAACARETKNIRLAPAVSLIQLRDPLKVAEDYALADQLSGGRIDMGIGKGFAPHEFRAFNMSQENVADRIQEGMEICTQFWAGKPFSYRGKFYFFDKIQPWPPAANGALPIWNAASNSKESFINAANKGYHLMMNHYPMSADALEEKFRWYCEAWEKADRKIENRKAMVAFMCHISDTEEKAVYESATALQEHAGAFEKIMLGQQWDTNYAGDRSTILKMCDDNNWQDVFRRRTLIGTPEQVAKRIKKYLNMGFTEISIVPRFAGLNHRQCQNTIKKITHTVLPMLKTP